LLNLLFAQFLKLERSRRKAGLWLAHLGLALLFIGEFSTALFQVESQMPIEVGQTRNYSEDSRRMELAVIDATDPKTDTVTSIPDSLLVPGAVLSDPSLPFKISVKRWYENASLGMRRPQDAPSEASAGIGPSLLVREAAPVTSDDAQNSAAALIEPVTDGGGLGTYWVSNALGAPQGFAREGRTWRLTLRPRRYYLPFSVTLKEFKHDIYPGTDIPKNFSSLIRLRDADGSEDRDALIYMNHPLRYGGKTFYQASFGQNDTLSVFQVVRNPGWLIPYLSCVMVALGLLLHFGVKLAASLRNVK
ncbi:MAG: cytochrome c biogenesis protein ResB, partial [Elusimicrobia bacterium]|nr:cytochrome c biogenesis protein ResB [Elusimicrobiota bacterium]